MRTLKLGPIDQIPLGEGRTFRVAGEEVAVFRSRSGGVFGLDARCPHKAAQLVDGIVGGDRVVCPLHNLIFDLGTGACLSASACADMRLRTYAVTLDEDGGIEIALAA